MKDTKLLRFSLPIQGTGLKKRLFGIKNEAHENSKIQDERRVFSRKQPGIRLSKM